MSDCFKTYNKALKELIDLVGNELPKNSLIDTIKRKYTAAITTDRTLLLTETGKEIFEFRDYIAEDRWSDLINKDWSQVQFNNNDVNQQSICHMIGLLRGIWTGYDADEKKYVKKLIKTLLTEYTRHLITNSA